jgi:hypothetical protein
MSDLVDSGVSNCDGRKETISLCMASLKSYGRGSLMVKCCGHNLKLDTYRLYNPIKLPEVV